MAVHATDEKPEGEDRHCDEDGLAQLNVVDGVSYRAQRDGEETQKQAAAVPPRTLETEDERQQVDRERQNPEKRHGGHVLGELIRRGQEKHRAARGERDPDDLLTAERISAGL